LKGAINSNMIKNRPPIDPKMQKVNSLYKQAQTIYNGDEITPKSSEIQNQ